MNFSHLRYSEPSDSRTTVETVGVGRRQETATVSLNDILPLLVDVVRAERTWLRDFDDDEVTIPMDLYEILLAYQHYCCPSA